MNWVVMGKFGKFSSLLAAALMLPAGLMASASNGCTPGEPTAASYTWNFTKEARQLITDLSNDANEIQNHAARLQSWADSDQLSWQLHGEQLMNIRAEVNAMGDKLCRLETIKRVVSPWEQKAINQAVPELRELADNTTDAIQFLNTRQGDMWMPTYRKYVENLASLSGRLSSSMNEYVAYAQVHREDKSLQKDLGMRTGS